MSQWNEPRRRSIHQSCVAIAVHATADRRRRLGDGGDDDGQPGGDPQRRTDQGHGAHPPRPAGEAPRPPGHEGASPRGTSGTPPSHPRRGTSPAARGTEGTRRARRPPRARVDTVSKPPTAASTSARTRRHGPNATDGRGGRPGHPARQHRHHVADRGELLVGPLDRVERLHGQESVRSDAGGRRPGGRRHRGRARCRRPGTRGAAAGHGRSLVTGPRLAQPAGRRRPDSTTTLPAARATAAVRSTESSSTTSTSSGGSVWACNDASRRGRLCSSLRAGITTDTDAASPDTVVAAGVRHPPQQHRAGQPTDDHHGEGSGGHRARQHHPAGEGRLAPRGHGRSVGEDVVAGRPRCDRGSRSTACARRAMQRAEVGGSIDDAEVGRSVERAARGRSRRPSPRATAGSTVRRAGSAPNRSRSSCGR